MKALYKNVAYLSIGVFVLLLLIFIWLGFTSSGLKFVLARVPQLEISGEIHGSLLDVVELENVRYKGDGINIAASGLQLDWQPSALLNKKLSVISLEFTSLKGRSIVGEQAATSEAKGIELPFDIVVERLVGTQLSWSHSSDPIVSFDRIDFSGEVMQSVLTINRLELKRSQDKMVVSGELDLSLANQSSVYLDFSHRLSSTLGLPEPFIGNVNVEGTWEKLIATHRSEAPYKLETKVELSKLFSREPSWSITSLLNEVSLPTFSSSPMSSSNVSGEISSSGSRVSSVLNANLTLSSNKVQYQIGLDSEVGDNELSLNSLSITPIDSSLDEGLIVVRGSIDNLGSVLNQTSAATRFSLSGEWRSLEFLSVISEINAPESVGEFSIDGDLNKYQFAIKSQTQAPQFEKLQLALQGHGASTTAVVDSLSVKGNGIDIATNAKIAFENGIGIIEFNDFSGDLYNEPLSAGLKATWKPGSIVVDRFDVAAADTKVQAKGIIGEASDLSWSLDIQNLALLSKHASGAVNVGGKLTGNISAPIVDANLDVKRFVYKDTAVESVKGDLKIGLRPKSTWHGSLDLDNASVAGKVWLYESKLELSGTLEQHTLKIDSRFDGSQNTTASWLGGYVNGVLGFTAAVNNVPASAAEPFIKTLPFQLAGDVNARFSGGYQTGRSLTFESDIESSKLVFESKYGSQQDLVARNFSVNLVADDNVRVEVSAALADGGVLNGKLSLADSILSDAIIDSRLNGEFQIAYQDLSSLSTLLPPSIQISGGLNATANLGGSLESPEARVNATLLGATLDMPEQGISLKEIELDIRSQSENRFQVIGTASAGEGRVALDGNLDLLSDGQVTSQITIVASDALFVDSPTIKAQGDADLVLMLQDHILDISGRVVTDKADLKIGTSMSAVSESPDLVLQELKPKVDATLVTMNLELDLGDQTTISANGLTGRLAGKPTIRLDSNGLLSSIGEVQLVGGKFTIVGEELTIDKGIASYAGGAITNPRLSFEATKTIGRVRAGVSIQGNVDSPELSLFSQPRYDDHDILALVFFEKTLDQLNSTDALKLVRIANALRGGSSDFKIDAITDKVAGYLGVDKFDVSLDSENDQRKLSVSSKVNSKLDIGYAYNFISSLQALFLRYKINDRWSIKSSLDVESGADINYEIETE